MSSYTNDNITFQINDTVHTVNSNDVPLDTSLNTYIRDYAHLTGTKFMCKEGGCGSCVVAVTSTNPYTKKKNTYAVNSCLLKIWSCHGCNITTIEKAKDYRYKNTRLAISDHLAYKNGSQCGYCSPGMVMNMYGLVKANPNISAEEIEKGFAGNICRCTGYKPILSAFRSFINPSSNDSDSYDHDIEDDSCINSCPWRRKRCSSSDDYGDDDENMESSFVEFALPSPNLKVTSKDTQSWYKVSSVREIFELFDRDLSNYMLIHGDTAQGVSPELFRDSPVDSYIDVSGVSELKKTEEVSSGLQLGGNVTLTDFISFLKTKKSKRQFKYTGELVDHLELVANVPVRNTGTIAGNLMIKYNMLKKLKAMFQSDIFLLLETVKAKITIRSKNFSKDYLLSEFMNLESMNYQVITNITLPPYDSRKYKIRTFKIMPRAQNAPASVNAGFFFQLNDKNIVESATIVYGGLNETFVHAEKTEKFLINKNISDEKVLSEAINNLKADIPQKIILDKLPLLAPKYRQQLAFNLFYKTMLFLNQNKVDPLYRLGAEKIEVSRGLSGGIEDYSSIKPEGPKSMPIPKLEAHIQCRGEAEYANDIPVIFGQLYGALVIAPQGPGTLSSIDISSASKLPGVVKLITASNIPEGGSNNMIELLTFVTPEYEELFASDKVLYAGQPVGIVVAQTQDLAIKASRIISKKIKVNMSGNKPLMTMKDVLDKYKTIPNERVIITNPIPPVNVTRYMHENIQPEKGEEIKADETFNLSGSFELGSQYHYTMELQTCVVVPLEDGEFDVFSSTQWPFLVQRSVAKVLGILENKVNVIVRRVGGAYGAKVTRPIYTACACTLAAQILNRPVRMVLDLETNMKSMGKRCSAKCEYDITVAEKTGEITHFNRLDIFDDKGITLNDPVNYYIFGGLVSCYKIGPMLLKNPKFKMYAVKTDTPSSSWCRAPGSLEGVFFIESIMNKIAHLKGLSLIDVRRNNIDSKKPFSTFYEDTLKKLDHENELKSVEKFNKNNRWRKQGYAITPIEFPIDFYLQFYCTVTVNGGDGSVSIAHGGCEIGQGINTKVAVAAAYVLGLPNVTTIQVKPTNVIYSPNNSVTGGSMTSDAVTYACLKASKLIKERLNDLKQTLKLPEDISWLNLVLTAYAHNVNLNATYMWTKQEVAPLDPDFNKLVSYTVPAICSSKVEVDILTGEHIVRSVKIYEQVGKSFAPKIDLGQVQGAFIMGLGYFTSEEILYDSKTGELQTNRTWNYDPPGAKDIPEKFDVTLINKVNSEEKEEGVLGAKATGEPPLCLSVSVFFAIKEAIRSAREDAGFKNDFDLMQPATIAVKGMSSLTDVSHFKINTKH